MSDFALPIRSAFLAGRPPSVAVHLLGEVSFERAAALQERLAFDACTQAAGPLTLLLCEHAPIITIGREGSRDDVQLDNVLWSGRQVEIHHVPRGGGAMFHHGGQLAVYPIVPLDQMGWTVGHFLDRFQAGLAAALAELQIPAQSRPGRRGLWGESGQLVSFGVAVKDWITRHGAQIHVGPAPHLLQFIATDPVGQTRVGSLSEETRSAVKMTAVRTRVARCMVEALGCETHHVYTGHPLLPHVLRGRHAVRRAS